VRTVQFDLNGWPGGEEILNPCWPNKQRADHDTDLPKSSTFEQISREPPEGFVAPRLWFLSYSDSGRNGRGGVMQQRVRQHRDRTPK
jgi:hypothetical protein